MILFISVILFAGQAVSADTLVLDFYSTSIRIKGEISFQPGQPVKISTYDSKAQVCELEILTQLPKGDSIQMVYRLKRPTSKLESGSLVTRKNEMAALKIGPSGDRPTTQFAAKWVPDAP